MVEYLCQHFVVICIIIGIAGVVVGHPFDTVKVSTHLIEYLSYLIKGLSLKI